jgi:hypothetical protein
MSRKYSLKNKTKGIWRIKMKLFTVAGYARFYRSLLRFCRDMTEDEAAEFTYKLYAANMETYNHNHPTKPLTGLDKDVFIVRLNNWQRQSYRTIVQFYRALEALILNIDLKIIAIEKVWAYRDLLSLLEETEERFIKAFSMPINDKRTIYGLCRLSLVPNKNEPGLCLLQDLG